MHCWYKRKCGNKVRGMVQVAQPCWEGSGRGKCVEDGMLLLGDKAGTRAPVAEASWAHTTAPFETNEKWDTWLVLIKGKCFDHCIKGELKKSNNGVFVFSSGFLLHRWAVHPYHVSTMPCEHGGLCQQPEPEVTLCGIKWALESHDSTAHVPTSYCKRSCSSFSILLNLTPSVKFCPLPISSHFIALSPALAFGLCFYFVLVLLCNLGCQILTIILELSMQELEYFQMSDTNEKWSCRWQVVSRPQHQRWRDQQLLRGEVEGMWRAGKKGGPMVKYCA